MLKYVLIKKYVIESESESESESETEESTNSSAKDKDIDIRNKSEESTNLSAKDEDIDIRNKSEESTNLSAKDEDINTCLSCGEVLGYTTFANDYIDFHENILNMRKKSVYNRFYYIENCLNRLCSNGLILSYKRRAMIYKIFDLIDITMSKINYDRKRLISINYILSMLFKMMGIKYDIEISKSKKTLKYYKKFLDDVMSLIGDQIHSITNQKRDYKCYLLKV